MNWKTAHKRRRRRERSQVQVEKVARACGKIRRTLSGMFRDPEFIRRLIRDKYETGQLLPSISPRRHYMIGGSAELSFPDGEKITIKAPDYSLSPPDVGRLLARSMGANVMTSRNPDGSYNHEYVNHDPEWPGVVDDNAS